MARSRQHWILSLAVASSVSMINVVVTASAQTLTDDSSSGAVSLVVASPASAHPWPCHLTVTGELRAIAELVWEQSPTFREQCGKLAASGAVMIVHPTSTRITFRAETRIGVTQDGIALAIARVRPSRRTIEHIAHELEHVLEYIEGVNFIWEARRGGSGVRLVGGAYETPRAVDAGRRVAREVREFVRAGREVGAANWPGAAR